MDKFVNRVVEICEPMIKNAIEQERARIIANIRHRTRGMQAAPDVRALKMLTDPIASVLAELSESEATLIWAVLSQLMEGRHVDESNWRDLSTIVHRIDTRLEDLARHLQPDDESPPLFKEDKP